MSITVPFDLSYEFEVKANAAKVFDLLADVPASASHFPKVDKLVDLGSNERSTELFLAEFAPGPGGVPAVPVVGPNGR